jgi:carbon storage regulator
MSGTPIAQEEWRPRRGRVLNTGLQREKQDLTMLVLSRKLGEKIIIGNNVVVTVVKIDRNQVRIGIEAPQDVPVFREEISPIRLEEQDKVSAAR